MSIKLRDLIRAVRACKTAEVRTLPTLPLLQPDVGAQHLPLQEERGVIRKECALIRTSFKDGNIAFQHRNVANTYSPSEYRCCPLLCMAVQNYALRAVHPSTQSPSKIQAKWPVESFYLEFVCSLKKKLSRQGKQERE